MAKQKNTNAANTGAVTAPSSKDKETAAEREKIRKSLIKQLKMQGKTDRYYLDLVEDYVSYWDVKRQLMQDIEKRGAVVSVTSGNGFTTTRANDSILMAQKTTALMLKILGNLGLDEPTEAVSADDYL